MDDYAVCMAAARLIRRGWIKGKYTDHHGRYCALGAIIKVKGSTVADRVFGHRVNSGRVSLYMFNDAPDTTQDEVIALLESGAYSMGGGRA